jgi:2-desacetyl-2-hydroxyethyl bacteriochlorophyllide A dehydrogenase
MKALVIEGPKKAVIKEVPYPTPKRNEIAIKVKNVGVCGTDFHIFAGEFLSPYPIIPGHEFSGVIDKIGEDVQGFKIGDRVSADPSLFCGECTSCLTLKGNQCKNWGALGNTVDGCMAEYVAVPSRNVIKIPDDMSFEVAAFIEPVACMVHGVNRLQLSAGDRVLIFGAGAMGQQLTQAISHLGASELVVVDVDRKKLDMALQWGATKGVLSKDIDKELGTDNYPDKFNAVVDATGIPAVIEKAFDFMGPTAKYLQFGVTPQDAKVQISPFKLYNKDWTIIGSMAINYTFLAAFEWMKAGRIQVKHLISKTISLDETIQLLAAPKSPDILKVQIKF